MIPFIEFDGFAAAARRQVRTQFARGGQAFQREWYRIPVDDQDPFVALCEGVYQRLYHDRLSPVAGAGLDNYAGVLFAAAQAKNRCATHVVQRLDNAVFMAFEKVQDVPRVAADQCRGRQIGKSLCEYFFVCQANRARVVHDQGAVCRRVFEYLASVEKLDVDGWVLAHENDVEFGECQVASVFEVEPVVIVEAYAQSASVAAGDAVPQVEIVLLEVNEGPVFALGRFQQTQRRVFFGFDPCDGVHYDAQRSGCVIDHWVVSPKRGVVRRRQRVISFRLFYRNRANLVQVADRRDGESSLIRLRRSAWGKMQSFTPMPSRRQLADAVRMLSMDAVQRAGSGHPGAPMGMADIAEVLWNDYLRHNPANPDWFDRDRFILSNGHAAMLLYALLHVSGYDLTLQQIRNFRQLHSQTPGHPEYGCAPGVETTTGPLGQGIANAVGMALAEKILAARFNRPGFGIVDHYTYVFAGDGCLMEGISHEACSLAGTLGLSKLILVYDDNGVSIDGRVEGWFTDDTPARFGAYGWHVVEGVDGHDAEAVARAFEFARCETSRPSVLCCKTTIGFGSPGKQGTADCHGAPLGEEEIAHVREALGWNYPPFEVPEEIYAAWDDAGERGSALEAEWNAKLVAYEAAYPQLADEFKRRICGALPEDWDVRSTAFIGSVYEAAKDMATRKASGEALAAYGEVLPELLGGSADLAASNVTLNAQSKGVHAKDADGNYIYFGVREFAMTAMSSGLHLHGGFIVYCATFLTFSDYARNAVRLAALMKQRVILVYTHDSIGLGEDGPTHQPIEHLSSLRLIFNLDVWRPCDAVESAIAWKCAIERRDGPSALAFSRQSLPHVERSGEQLAHVPRGGYVLFDNAGQCRRPLDLILIATGSEVALALEVCWRLDADDRCVRLVSMPCAEAFERQDETYRRSVLPRGTPRLVVEAAAADWWYKYAGSDGRVFGIEGYGESAPGDALFKHFGFTVERIAQVAGEMLG